MSRMLGVLVTLAGYVCAATVISAALGYGYLKKTGKLDDEKLFRIMAIVQDVDLAAIEAANEATEAGVPEEEPSFNEQQRRSHTASLHFDAKQKQLAVSLVNFDYQLKQLNAAIENYAQLKKEVADYLDEQGKLVLREAMQEVGEQMEVIKPKESKALLIKYITDNRIDEVIMLLGNMKPRSREAILKTFVSDEDKEMLYRIQRKMLAGEPVKPFIDEKIEALEQLKAQEK